MVDVVDEGVQRPHPLLEPRLEPRPLLRRDDARDDVEGDQPLGAFLLPVDREGDADPVEQGIRLGALLRQTLGRLGRSATRRNAGSERAQRHSDGIHFVIRCGRQTIPLKSRKEDQAAGRGVGLIMDFGVLGCNAGRRSPAGLPETRVIT